MKNEFDTCFLLPDDKINVLLNHYKSALKSIHQYKTDPFYRQIEEEKESPEFKRFTDICSIILDKADNVKGVVPNCTNIKYGYRIEKISISEPYSKENIIYDKFSRMFCRDAFYADRDENNVVIQNVIERFVIIKDIDFYSLDFLGMEIPDFIYAMYSASKVSIYPVDEHPCMEFIVTDFYKPKQEYIDDRESVKKFLDDMKNKN